MKVVGRWHTMALPKKDCLRKFLTWWSPKRFMNYWLFTKHGGTNCYNWRTNSCGSCAVGTFEALVNESDMYIYIHHTGYQLVCWILLINKSEKQWSKTVINVVYIGYSTAPGDIILISHSETYYQPVQTGSLTYCPLNVYHLKTAGFHRIIFPGLCFASTVHLGLGGILCTGLFCGRSELFFRKYNDGLIWCMHFRDLQGFNMIWHDLIW